MIILLVVLAPGLCGCMIWQANKAKIIILQREVTGKATVQLSINPPSPQGYTPNSVSIRGEGTIHSLHSLCCLQATLRERLETKNPFLCFVNYFRPLKMSELQFCDKMDFYLANLFFFFFKEEWERFLVNPLVGCWKKLGDGLHCVILTSKCFKKIDEHYVHNIIPYNFSEQQNNRLSSLTCS